MLGELGRLTEHLEILKKGYGEVVRLRRLGAGGILYFHEVATMPGAECKFYAMHRFPQLLDNSPAALQAKLLPKICESLNTASFDKLGISRRNRQKAKRAPIGMIKLSYDLMDYFRKASPGSYFKAFFPHS